MAPSLERAVAISQPQPAKSLVNISPGTPVKTNANVRILPICTHPRLQTHHKISEVTGPKFTKFLLDLEGSSAVLVPEQ